ncbi:hypothetical protein [Achromobacter xylosoxidans]|uniref:hypothetical protein n=1 Tax=Alcaligenes xylosoxydans xylosoxydans TaxID=85698 RepID=UPI001F1336A9|nr:hypothetical protein [Achromobacter xylosoxidans]
MQEEITRPEPNYEDPKEVYAFFGLAFYKANVLEHGVLNLAVALLAQGNLGVTIDDVNRLYESFETKTFGHILHVAKERYSFSQEFSRELDQALAHRNYLAHGFFKKHDINHMSKSGRKVMIDELIDMWMHLATVDEIMDEYWMSAWKEHGITKEWIEKQMQEYVKAERPNDA